MSSSFIEMRGQRGQKKTTTKKNLLESPDLVGYINKTKQRIQPVYYVEIGNSLLIW